MFIKSIPADIGHPTTVFVELAAFQFVQNLQHPTIAKNIFFKHISAGRSSNGHFGPRDDIAENIQHSFELFH